MPIQKFACNPISYLDSTKSFLEIAQTITFAQS